MHRRPAKRAGTLPMGLVILHEDRDILVVDKPAGLLSMGTDTDKTRTAHYILNDYVRKGQSKSRHRIFIVHRLDRDTSGVLLFAKSQAAKFRLQEEWPQTRKKYVAVVHGICEKTSDTISTYLAENRAQLVYSTTDHRVGRPAKTSYRVLEQSQRFALLELDLWTGRKHQIRVHLAEIGHAVVGDKKYGREGRTTTRLALHAKTITFGHPFDGTPTTVEAPVPATFKALMRSGAR